MTEKNVSSEQSATKPETVVIVGGVAAGMSAATRLRRNSENTHIIVFERGEYVSFANCGLPYHVGGVIAERGDLLLQTPESLHARFKLDVRTRHEVLAIDPAGRTVKVLNRITGDRQLQEYDALVLATGASPMLPPIPGIDRAMALRDVADLDRMMATISKQPRSAVILGGGFIGLELAENLARRGLTVTIVELSDQLLAPLDPEMAFPAVAELARHGVTVRTGVGAESLLADHVVLTDGSSISADIVVAAIGVQPESTLAKQAGLDLGPRGGILVDHSQRTSAAGIYAAGDVALKTDAINNEPEFVPLAQTANRHGRLVADTITGRSTQAAPVLGTSIVKVFDLTLATTGWNEKRLSATGRPKRIIHTHAGSHAGYYPGAQTISLKLLVDPQTDLILGAQAVGGEGVDKRIDIIATALRAGLTATALADLELAYAPQFGSAKDPVNMLGYIADNLATGTVTSIQWSEVAAAGRNGGVVVDVRTEPEFAAGSLPGALNIPLDQLRERLDEIPQGPVVVYCQVGQRGNVATRILAQHDRTVVNLDGGYRTWRDSPAGRD